MSVTVTVACKLPHGLALRLFDMVDHDEAQQGGGYKTVKRAQPRGEKIVTLNGYLTRHRNAEIQPAAPGSSYALTHGIDKAFFDEWMRQNAKHPAVLNELIFGSEKQDAVSGRARENNKRLCGFEPIDRSKLPKGVQNYKEEDKAA